MAPIAFILFHLSNFLLTIMLIWIVMGWLYSFGVLNTANRVIYQIYDMLGRLVEPVLNPIRRFLPAMNGVDISPIILVILIWTLQRYVLLPLI
jgi:YggT family protein